jgi:hypothetical protein
LGSLNYTAFESVTLKLGGLADSNRHSAVIQSLESGTKIAVNNRGRNQQRLQQQHPDTSDRTVPTTTSAAIEARESKVPVEEGAQESKNPNTMTGTGTVNNNLRRRSPLQLSQAQ